MWYNYRRVYLPWPVEPEGVEVSYGEGGLKVCLPRPRMQRVSVVETGQKED